LKNLMILILLFSLPQAGAAPLYENFAVTEIAPGNFVHYGLMEDRSPANFGDNANIGFIIGAKCVMAIDTGGSLHVGLALRRAIRERTALPVCHVVLTHAHPDHFFGAAAFQEDHPQFIGHINLARQLSMRARPYLNSLRRDLGEALAEGSEIVKPTMVVQDTLVIDLGGRSVEIRAWPTAHTDDDLTVLDQQTGTWWLSDLLFVDHTPVVDGSLKGFLDVIGDLKSRSAAQVVAGHGRSPWPWPRPLDDEERYFRVILEETRLALKHKKTIQQAVDEVGLSEESKWVNFDAYHRRNVTTAYTELEWED
jgi:quinoprotein relay system zinc metallohydrolase 2